MRHKCAALIVEYPRARVDGNFADGPEQDRGVFESAASADQQSLIARRGRQKARFFENQQRLRAPRKNASAIRPANCGVGCAGVSGAGRFAAHKHG